MMKRAPGASSAFLRLRRVGLAQARSASMLIPQSCSATSRRLRSTISWSLPAHLAIGRLDERFKRAGGGSRTDRLRGLADSVAQVRCEPGGHEQGAGIERDK